MLYEKNNQEQNIISPVIFSKVKKFVKEWMMSVLKYLKDFVVIFLLLLVGIFFITEGFTQTASNNKLPSEVKDLLSNIKIDTPVTFKNMTVYPLIANKLSGETFMLLDDSMNDGTLEIKEKGSGSVNNLELYKNESKYPIFIMSGEIVKGAKQDRIISNDMILGKDSKLYNIAVYCVEQGRWVKQTDKFAPASVVGSNKLRSKVAQKESQSTVWNEVAKKNDSMGVSSSTSNYRASYESKAYKEDAAEYVNHFLPVAKKNQKYVGVIIKIDDKVSNMDVFGEHDTFAALWPKLLKSYTQDAVDTAFSKNIPKVASAQSLLNSLNNSDFEEIANPGLGTEYKVKSSNTAGSALIYNNNVTHIAIFADNEITPEPVKHQNIDYQQNQNIQQQYQSIPNINRPHQNR